MPLESTMNGMPRPQSKIPVEYGFLRIDEQVCGPFSREVMEALNPLIARIDGAEVAIPRLRWSRPQKGGALGSQAATRGRSLRARVWTLAFTVWHPLLPKPLAWFFVILLLAVAFPTSLAFCMGAEFPWNLVASLSGGLAIGLVGRQHLLGAGAGRRRTLIVVSAFLLQVGLGCAVAWFQSDRARASGVEAALATMSSWKPGVGPEEDSNRASLVSAAQKSMELELGQVLAAAKSAMAAQKPGEAKELIDRAASIALYSQRYDVDNLAGYWQYQWGTMQRAIDFLRASTAFRPETIADENATLAAALARCQQSSDERQKHEAIEILRAALSTLPNQSDDWLVIGGNLSAALLDLDAGNLLQNAQEALDYAVDACSCRRTSTNRRALYVARLNGAKARARLYFLGGQPSHLCAALDDCCALLSDPEIELEPGVRVIAQALGADLRMAVGDLKESDVDRFVHAIESGLTASKITEHSDPSTWAYLQRTLACLRSQPSKIQDPVSIRKARTSFQSACRVWTPTTHPSSYATTKAAETRLLLECDMASPGSYLDEVVESAYGALAAIAGLSLPGVEGELCSNIAAALESPARKSGQDIAGALRMRARARQCFLDARQEPAAAMELSNLLGVLRTMPQQQLEAGLMEESLTAAEVALSARVLEGSPIALANLMANLGGAHAMCQTGDRCMHLRRAKELLEAASRVFKESSNSTAHSACVQLLREVAMDGTRSGCSDTE